MQLPKFIYSAAKEHNTSLGNNKAFPNREDVSFDYIILKRRYNQVIEEINQELGYIPTIEEAENLLNKAIHQAIKIEEPLKPQLEKLCEAIVTSALGVPQETVLLDCQLVNKIEPDVEIRILPEYDDEEEELTYTFDDVEEANLANDSLLKRRMVNCLVQGVSYLLMLDYFDNEKINQWSDELIPLYSKIIALNDFLLFSKKEEITDKNPMLGAYVETHLGDNEEKTVISSQGLVFPLLLQESFRGFFELFGSHGLPSDIKTANYIIHHADFVMAEAWDLRLGVPLWQLIESCIDTDNDSSLYPYLFSSIVQEKKDEFNDVLQNIFLKTKKAKKYVNGIISQIKQDKEYNLFKQDIEKFNLDQCLITDDIISEDSNDDIIYSELFKDWFGDWEHDPKHSSFVVDNNGMPMRCYHSTEADFDEFNPDKIGSGGAGAYHGYGFNFTTLPNNTYGKYMKTVYLNARKPLSSIRKKITLNQLIKIFLAVDKGEGDSIACEFTGNYVKINGNGYYNEVVKAAKQLYEYAEGDLDIYSNISIASHCSPQKVINIFSKLGYDSSCEYTEDGRLSVVIVFSTSQIMNAPKELKEEKGVRTFDRWYDTNNPAIKAEQERRIKERFEKYKNKLQEWLPRLYSYNPSLLEDIEKHYKPECTKEAFNYADRFLKPIYKELRHSIMYFVNSYNTSVNERINWLENLGASIEEKLGEASNFYDNKPNCDEDEFEWETKTILENIITSKRIDIEKVIDTLRDLYETELDKEYYGIEEASQKVNKPHLNENKYDAAFNDACNALMQFKNEKTREYQNPNWYNFEWMKRNHPEVKINPEDIRKYQELESNYQKITKLWNSADDEEENTQAQETKVWVSEQSNLISLAIKKYGLTYDLGKAGYILPDGRLLNFSEGGTKDVDHRNIESIYKDNNIRIWDDTYRYNYVVDFLNHGAIRIDNNAGNIDMTMEPTSAELSVIKQIVRNNDGEVTVEFTSKVGDTEHSVDYNNAKPQRVVADILRYYREGIKPLPDNQLHEDASFESWFQGSKVINPDGTPKLMYRGDENEIDTFDRQYSKSSNLYGTGFYFTDSENHASQYGNTQGYYLRIIHPLSTNSNEITKKQLYNFLVAVDKDEDYGLYNYGQDSTPETVLKSVWGKADFAMLQDINASCIGDLVEATLLFNKVNGTNFDGFILDTETVVFDNSQIRKTNKSLHESKIIEEGISDITYHFCSLSSLYDILDSGKIKLTMSSNMADAYHKTKLFYLSTQRSKNNKLGYAGNSTHHGDYSTARIELDGDLLKRDGYQGMPIDYWGVNLGKQSDIGLNASRVTNYNNRLPETDDDKRSVLRSQQTSSNFEFEDRIFSNKPYISLKYIKRIDCFIPNGEIQPQMKVILQLSEKDGIFTAFYASSKDFVLQTNNTLNNKIKALEGNFEGNPQGKDEESRQLGNSETVAILSSALMYYNYYNNINNGTPSENTFKELYEHLKKFGLERYFDYCKDKMPRMVMFLDNYIGTSLIDRLRKANTNELSRNNLSENVMLYAQYVLNHYGVNSILGLKRYFDNHPWKKERPSKENIQEYVDCISLKYDGSSEQIIRADDKSFWGDRSIVYGKEYFYNEIIRQLEEDNYNEENGYEHDRYIYHKSKNFESFKKYLQHLMHNDNLSLYEGVNLMLRLFNGDQSKISSMFGYNVKPIKLDKDKFIELENKISWSDSQSIINSLFGSEDGYYEYRWPKH